MVAKVYYKFIRNQEKNSDNIPFKVKIGYISVPQSLKAKQYSILLFAMVIITYAFFRIRKAEP